MDTPETIIPANPRSGSGAAPGPPGPEGPMGPEGPPGTGASLIRRHDNAGGYDYCGTAPTGSADADPVWDIKRLTLATDGTVTATETASSVAWTDRATATYL